MQSRVALGDSGKRLDIRIPMNSGIAGRVVRTGRPANWDTGRKACRFRITAARCLPLRSDSNREGGAFTQADEAEFRGSAEPLGVILQISRIMESLRPKED